MSLQNSESSVSKSFQELLNYVSNLGEHINKLYTHIETLENNLTTTKADLTQSIITNKTELERVTNIVITKSELNNLLQKINEPFEKFTPPKTPTRSQDE
jgi:chromosome segregation ATPase